jgi:glycosyltransferase involved in cell wall biosynthesis
MEANRKYQNLFREKKCCVIIPTYNNSTTLPDLIEGVSRYTHQIIVVNDGSTDKTKMLLENRLSNKVDVVDYLKNRGKGYAIKKGFLRAMDLGYEYAITIDSDGQHLPADLPYFINHLSDKGSSIVVGERRMPGKNVPAKNTFANKFSNFWFRLYTGKRIPDTQCGYRLYPLKQIQDMKFYSTKYEFEVEVLVRSSWNGIEIDSVPIDVYYPTQEKRVTHFRPIRDFIRISMLNTILFFVAFFYIKPFKFFREYKRKGFKRSMHELFLTPSDSNLKLSLSVTLGIFCGILPIWGWQLAVAIFLAFLFKMNKPIVITTANISIPPMIPFVLYFSYKTGGIILGNGSAALKFSRHIDFEMVMTNIFQYVIGSLVFGALLSLLLGGITFLSLSFFRRNKRTSNELQEVHG